MTYPEQWSIDAAENTKQPPIGAPENGLPGDKISDCFRVVMAGVRECWNRVGTLGLQNKDNVDLTGGRIRAAVVIEGAITTTGTAANSLKLEGLSLAQVVAVAVEEALAVTPAGLTLQSAYNTCWPLGSLRWLLPAQSPSILVPTGITATWTEHTALADRLVAIKGTIADTWGSGLGIGVTVANHALTVAEMPLHGHPTRASTENIGTADIAGGLMLNDDNLANYPAYTGTPDNDPGQQIGGTGGGAGHSHTATASLPAGASLRLYRRTA